MIRSRHDEWCCTREAVAALRRDAGASLDDDATLLALARHVLGGPLDAGRASYQVVLRVCPECGSGAQLGDGALVPVSSDVVEMAQCDEQAVQAPPAPSFAANDVTDQPAAHVGQRAPRARQKVPPAVRRAVLLRDEHRCRVPGCHNARFLDLHHIVPRSTGGRNDIENILTLCGAHHRAVHHGALVIAGQMAGAVSFRHGDGREYGNVEGSLAPDVRARAFAALRQLGFRSGEADAAHLQRGSAWSRGHPALPRSISGIRRSISSKQQRKRLQAAVLEPKAELEHRDLERFAESADQLRSMLDSGWGGIQSQYAESALQD